MPCQGQTTWFHGPHTVLGPGIPHRALCQSEGSPGVPSWHRRGPTRGGKGRTRRQPGGWGSVTSDPETSAQPAPSPVPCRPPYLLVQGHRLGVCHWQLDSSSQTPSSPTLSKPRVCPLARMVSVSQNVWQALCRGLAPQGAVHSLPVLLRVSPGSQRVRDGDGARGRGAERCDKLLTRSP